MHTDHAAPTIAALNHVLNCISSKPVLVEMRHVRRNIKWWRDEVLEVWQVAELNHELA
jgi:hypothetical protein